MHVSNNSGTVKLLPKPLRIVLSLFVLIAAAALACYSWNLFVADRTIQSVKTVESYTRALDYDPADASLWWQRGRLYHYSVERSDVNRAISDYRKALELNPRLGMAWVDLSDALEQTGKFDQASEALERAFEVQPFSPLIRWQAGNYFLRRSDLPRMYACFKTACRYDSSKLGIAMETAWKIDPERDGILQKLIPDDFMNNARYMNFLVGKNELELAMVAWQRCMKNPLPPDYRLRPAMLFHFIDRLLSENRTEEALRVWNDILRKALTGLSDSRHLAYESPEASVQPGNPVWNASFENEFLRGGFDWRYPEMPEIQFKHDSQNRLKGLKSLEVVFEGANVSTGGLYQIVPISSPGDYVLDFYVKTHELTTDRIPYISIAGYPDATGASGRSASFPATTDWIKLSVPFHVDRACSAVRLSLCRDRSSNLDNRIKGSLWLDGFAIQAATVSPR